MNIFNIKISFSPLKTQEKFIFSFNRRFVRLLYVFELFDHSSSTIHTISIFVTAVNSKFSNAAVPPVIRFVIVHTPSSKSALMLSRRVVRMIVRGHQRPLTVIGHPNVRDHTDNGSLELIFITGL